MVHPIIPQIINLATPVAQSLGLELVGAVFQTNQSPPVLRVDIRNLQGETSIGDCERMSRAFEATLDVTDVIPDAYILEISSPGVPHVLSTDREFVSFRGFPVTVFTHESQRGQKEKVGQLIRRDATSVYLNQRGRTIAIPRNQISRVQLDERH